MKRMIKSGIGLLLSAVVLVAHSNVGLAQTASASASGPITPEEAWKLPTMASLNISPNGKYLAVTMPNRGRMNLSIVDLEARSANALTGYEEFDVQGIVWIGNDRLLYSLGQNNSPTGPGAFDGGGLFVISRDGKETKRLSSTVREARARGDSVFRGLNFYRRIPGSTDEVIASGNMTSADSTDLYRLNLNTGKFTLLTQGRPSDFTSRWILDKNLVPRIVTGGIRDTLTSVVYYRAGEGSPWTEIARYERDKGPILVPLAIESDDKTLQVAYNGGRDTMGVFKFDPITKKLGELIAAHPRFDMGADASGDRVAGVITEPETDKLIGYAVDAGKPEVVWLDEKNAGIQKALDAALPGMINGFRRLPGNDKRLLVTSYSSTRPVRWYLFDQEMRTLERIGISRPWLEGKLTEQRVMSFKTRDGLDIAGYYFLPKDYKPGTKLPTVVHIHGGPGVRADSYGGGFGTIEGQLFASHGYAVIVPNFRITPGLGSKIYYSGFGSFGRQMSDDHEDAVKWGIEQGFVDPDRVCMSGASYGGYATLQALVRNTNGMWKCGVAGLAVTDLQYQITSRDVDFVASEASVNFWKTMLGIKTTDDPVLRTISPVYNAEKIKRPVMFYSGQDDSRVPIPQINRMVAELEKAGNPAEHHIVKAKEGHGFGRLENNIDNYTKILAFLDKHIGKKK
ncbi:MAG: S9 family peptidase [Betaproteobacteria bacterium]|nr:S9 family peptidase [Betaproteobacteria bacterium]